MTQSVLGELADGLIEALFLGMRDHTVLIGQADNLRPEHAHGVIHSRDESGVVVRYGFMADKPHKLKRPHPESVASLFKQAKLLGFNPQQIEVSVGKYRRVYEENRLDPVYVQPLN